MPVVTVDMWEGRTVEQNKQLAEGITSVLTTKLGISPEHVIIIIKDNPGTIGQQGASLLQSSLPRCRR